MSSSSQILSRPTTFDPSATTGRKIVSLKVGFSWSFVGWVGYAACQWLMLSIMAKLGNPTIVGQFAFALAVSAPVFMLTNLQLRGVQSTDARCEYTFPDYVTLRLVSSLVAIFGILAACPFLKVSRSAAFVIILVALFKALESFGDVIAGLMQKFERLDAVAIALLLRGGLSISLFGVCFAVWRNLPLALVIWISVAASVIAAYDFRMAGKLAKFDGGFGIHLDWKILRNLAVVSLPLGLVSAITSFNTNIPRYTIEHVLSIRDLGIFASVAYPVTAATIVSNSLGQSALARLSRLFAEGRLKEFQLLVCKLVGVGIGLAVIAVSGAFFFGDKLLTALYTAEYARQGNLFVILALTAGLNSIGCFLVYSLTATRQFRVQLPISLFCMLATIIGSAVFVPRFHLVGAAMALACSASLLIIVTGITLQMTIRKHQVN